MNTHSYGRFSTFALLTAAMALATGAQAQTPASSVTKAATAPAAATAAGPSQTPPPTAPTVARPAGSKGSPITVTAAQATPPKKPGQEGVTMHGHWIVDLRNADGTLAEHRDFENSLLNPGVLLQVIAGNVVIGDLGITIASTGSSVCANGGASGLGGCLVATSSTAGLGGYTCGGTGLGYCNYTLKEVANGGGGNGAITLTGTMPVLDSGSVTQVGTQIFSCGSGGTGFASVDPVGCYNQTEGSGYGFGNFSGTNITPLAVTTGQTLVFTVVLTFS